MDRTIYRARKRSNVLFSGELSVDAGRILGGLLANRAGRAQGNGQVLGQILSGVAEITHAANSHKRFPPAHHGPFEHIVRESVHRHHQQGGRFPGPADAWIRNRPATRVPPPRHNHDDHHAGLSYSQRAELLTIAMIMAAQADGQLDEAEQNAILAQLHPLSREEEDFLRRHFRRRHDVADFVRDVPNGMEYEVYSISLSAIHLDTQAEAQYLRTLAECLRLQPDEVNVIHHRCGAPPLYR